MDENSISIINRTNGQVTGEKADALPIKLVSNFSWAKMFGAGFITGVILLVLIVSTIKRQVVVVEVAGKAENYEEYRVN